MEYKIPIFIKHFGIRNIELIEMFAKKGLKISPQSMSQKLDSNFETNKFNLAELIFLKEIEKEFLNEWRRKLVTYKALKYRENEQLQR